MKEKKLFVLFLELVVLIFILFLFLKKVYPFFSKSAIFGIKRENIVVEPVSELKYFYEPKAKVVIDASTGEGKIFINSDTLNDDKEHAASKAADVYRIITMGASWVYGLGVPTQNNWPKTLESILSKKQCQGKKIEIINLGVPGYDPRYELERFKKRGLKYNPDLVIWFFTDEFKRIQEALLPILSRHDLGRDTFRILSVQTSILRMGGLDNVYKYQLTNLSKFSDLYKGKLLLVVEPEPWLTNETERKLIRDYGKSRQNTGYYEIAHKIFQLSDLNLSKKIQGDHHPNIKGHKVMAEEIADYSISNKFVPCR